MRATDLAAYSHQDLPFERLVEVLNPTRALALNPLFQVVLTFQNDAPASLGDLPGLTCRFEPVDTVNAKFVDLSLSLAERRASDGSPAGIDGVLDYSTDLFERATVEAIAGRLIRLLQAAVVAPDRAIGSLDILSPEERHAILRGWNDTARAIPSDTLPELFAAQAARTPEAVAVVFEDRSFTYAELDARANQLAHHLRGLGVSPETVVGVCAERSPEMLIGFLAILKASATYLPLDPNYPPDRLAYMLSNARVPVLLSQAALLGRLPKHDARIVCLDADWPAIAREPTTVPVSPSHPESNAYVIYTSGSTGAPKGAMVTHRGMLNHLAAKAHDLGLGPQDVIAQTASQCFDISVWQFSSRGVPGRRARACFLRRRGRRPAAVVRADGRRRGGPSSRWFLHSCMRPWTVSTTARSRP